MPFQSREILERLQQVGARLDRVEAALAAQAEVRAQREELLRTRARLDALGRQSLHLVELLADARREIERLKSGRQ